MINKRQYIILSFFLTRTMFLGGGFSLLVEVGKNNLLITSFLGMLLGYFLLYLFYKKKGISKVSWILISIWTLIIAILSNTTLASTYLLFQTPTLFIMLMFIIVLLYGSFKEVKVMGRLSELCIPFSFIVFFIAMLSLASLINLDNLLPLFNTSFFDFFRSIIIFTATSLLPNLLILNYQKDLKFKDIGLGYIVGSLSIMVVMFYILSVYGFEFASIVRFPEYLILKNISILNYISNIENILIMEWIMNVVLTGLICIKVLKENVNIYLFSTIILFIALGSEFLLNRNYVNVLYIKKYFYCISSLLILFSLVMKKSKNN